jgi:hypothetical protein
MMAYIMMAYVMMAYVMMAYVMMAYVMMAYVMMAYKMMDGLHNDGLRNDGLRNDGLHIGFFAEKITLKLKYILNQNLSVVDAIPPLTLPNDVGCYQENRCFESKFRRHSEIRVGIILIIS